MYYFLVIRDYEPIVELVGETREDVALAAWSKYVSKQLATDIPAEYMEREIEDAAASGEFVEAVDIFLSHRSPAAESLVYFGEIDNVSKNNKNRDSDERVFRVTEDVDLYRENPNYIIAEFHVQEWRGPDGDKKAYTKDRQYWDVTQLIEEMPDEDVEKLRNHSYTTDQLVAPHSTHDGPHAVEVTEQIQTYWRHNKGGKLWE